MSTSTILFVDDDPAVLNGLRRMLYKMRSTWQMDFAAGGAAAMQMMAQRSYDLLVTDIRMPDVDGVQLLTWVQEKYPQTIRFVLSGQSDSQKLVQTVGLAHQSLAKPCHAETLKQAIARAERLRSLLTNADLQRLVARMKELPVIPTVLAELTAIMASSDQSLRHVGELIARDLGLAAKVLKLVNSPLFGLRQQINDPQQAVVLLGLDTINALLLATSTFDALQNREIAVLAEEVHSHAMRVGRCARYIAKECGDAVAVEWALAGSLLHDVGKLILRSQLPTVASLAAEVAHRRAIPLHRAEVEILGVTHAEVGAYLLGLWGFDERLVTAIAAHHQHPTYHSSTRLNLHTVLYIANQLDHAWFPTGTVGTDVDLPVVEALGITAEQMMRWQTYCQSSGMQRGVIL